MSQVHTDREGHEKGGQSLATSPTGNDRQSHAPAYDADTNKSGAASRTWKCKLLVLEQLRILANYKPDSY